MTISEIVIAELEQTNSMAEYSLIVIFLESARPSLCFQAMILCPHRTGTKNTQVLQVIFPYRLLGFKD